MMLKRQAFKFELMPDAEAIRKMNGFVGCCRFVSNKVLAMQKENHEAGGKFLSYFTLAKELTGWRDSQELNFLKEAPYHSLQHAIKHVIQAFKNFFEGRAAYPNFKKKNKHDSFRYPDANQIKLEQHNHRIFLPKLGWVRYRKSRMMEGKVCNATIVKEAGKWFISIQTECEITERVHHGTSSIGIDLGITHFATLSTGEHIQGANSFKKKKKALAKYQKKLSKKQKFSKNWQKAKKKVAKVHSDIKNARIDFLHKTSTAICKKHAVICIEDLKVKNMSQSAKGTIDKPGKSVLQKSGLNRRILDQGWGLFRMMLAYKALWFGAKLIKVPPAYTSQTCPQCGHVSQSNRISQAKFQCVTCDFKENADYVGALNILERGMRLLACGETMHVDHSMKQEPTEAYL